MKNFINAILMIFLILLIVGCLFYVVKFLINKEAKNAKRSHSTIVSDFVEKIKSFMGLGNDLGTKPTTFWRAKATLGGIKLNEQGIAWDEFQGNKPYTFGRGNRNHFVINHNSVSKNALDLYCDSDQNFWIEPYNDKSPVRIEDKEGKLVPLRNRLPLNKDGLYVYIGNVKLTFYKIDFDGAYQDFQSAGSTKVAGSGLGSDDFSESNGNHELGV